MTPKRILMVLVVILIAIGVGVDVFIVSTPTTNQKPTAQPAQNQNTQKIGEGCAIIPYDQEKVESGDGLTDVRSGAICHFSIHDDLPIYNFHLVGNPEYNTIDRIEITKGTEITFSQTLEARMLEPPYRDAEFFSAEDINFDGYKDIKLMSTWGVTGYTQYNYWLFDSQKNQFIANQELSELTNPTAEPETKTITTFNAYGMLGCIYDYGTYKFGENGKLILIRWEEQEWVEKKKSFLRTISELKNGKMMVVSTKVNNCE